MPFSFTNTNSSTGIKDFTADLSLAAGTYDLCTASGGVHIDLSQIAIYVATAGLTLTSVSIQTNQTNTTTIMSAVEGAVANLIIQKNIVRAIVTPSITLRNGQKIQYTIAGLTRSGSLKVTIPYTAITSGALIN